MITREDFNIAFPRNYEELRSLEDKIEQILKERDAYREVAIHLQNYGAMISPIQPTEPIDGAVDAEAQRILEAKKERV